MSDQKRIWRNEAKTQGGSIPLQHQLPSTRQGGRQVWERCMPAENPTLRTNNTKNQVKCKELSDQASSLVAAEMVRIPHLRFHPSCCFFPVLVSCMSCCSISSFIFVLAGAVAAALSWPCTTQLLPELDFSTLVVAPSFEASVHLPVGKRG